MRKKVSEAPVAIEGRDTNKEIVLSVEKMARKKIRDSDLLTMDKLMSFGWYQLSYCLLVFMHVAQEWSNVTLLQLAGKKPLIECVDQHNASAVLQMADACARMANGSCGEYTLHHQFHSWTIEWRLFCAEWRAFNNAATIQMLGILFGTLCFGQLSDVIGRKKAWVAAWLALTCVCLWSAFVHSPWLYVWLRLPTGFFMGGMMSVSFTYGSEMMSSRGRFIAKLVLSPPATVVLYLVPAAYLLRDWRPLTMLANGTGAAALLLFIMFAHESPLWLMRKGDAAGAVRVLHSVCNTWNRRHINVDTLRRFVHGEMGVKESDKKKRSQNYYMWHLFCTPTLAKYTASMAFCWFATSLVSYGIVFNVGSLGGSIYLNIVYMELMRQVASLLLLLLDRGIKGFGRKLVHQCSMVLVALCLVATAVFQLLGPQYSLVIRIMNFVARGGTAGIWAIVYLMSVELYPTAIRNAANSFGSMWARVGGAISPQVLLLSSAEGLNMTSAAFWLYALIAASEAILFWLTIPETKGKPLPEHMPHRAQWFALCRGSGADTGADGAECGVFEEGGVLEVKQTESGV